MEFLAISVGFGVVEFASVERHNFEVDTLNQKLVALFADRDNMGQHHQIVIFDTGFPDCERCRQRSADCKRKGTCELLWHAVADVALSNRSCGVGA